MMNRKNWKSVLTIAALTLAMVMPALADGPSTRRGGRPDGPPPIGTPGVVPTPGANAPAAGLMRPDKASPRGLLAELIYPCQADCFKAERACNDAADAAALAAIKTSCSAEVTAVQTACAPDPTVQACKDAAAALQTCAATALADRQAAVKVCHDDENTCRSACTTAQ